MRNSWLCLIALVVITSVLPWGNTQAQPSSFQVIPDEAIRLRILADSNAEQDQKVKRLIRDEVNAEITEWVEDLTSIEAARALIRKRLPELEAIVAQTLEVQSIDQTYTVDYDSSVSFPTKLYGSYLYPAGEYEAILITLGEGEGDNWWCVLFPPLCFLDFSNGTSVAAEETAEAEPKPEQEEQEVEFFLVKIWNSIFS
ncbi:stage II sporulation protein R [Halobacillus fulvus]|nr:stage II sporulation protein R [Halobacillus fulvus]